MESSSGKRASLKVKGEKIIKRLSTRGKAKSDSPSLSADGFSETSSDKSFNLPTDADFESNKPSGPGKSFQSPGANSIVTSLSSGASPGAAVNRDDRRAGSANAEGPVSRETESVMVEKSNDDETVIVSKEATIIKEVASESIASSPMVTRAKGVSSSLSRSSHSYSNFFSSTNLRNLDTAESPVEARQTPVKLDEPLIDPDSSKMLYRTGSVVWSGDVNESKAKSKSFLNFKELEDFASSSDEGDDFSNRPAYHRAYTSYSVASDGEDEELVLHFTPKSEAGPNTSPVQSDGTTIGLMVLRVVDWLLGIKQDSAKGLVDAVQPEKSQALTKQKKILQRDEEQSTPVDIAWVLALAAGNISG